MLRVFTNNFLVIFTYYVIMGEYKSEVMLDVLESLMFKFSKARRELGK